MVFQKLRIDKYQLLLIIVFIAVFIFIFAYSYLTQNINTKSISKSKAVIKNFSGLPVRLIIPKIGIDTSIEYVGVTSSGAMDVPENTLNVGWFKLGPRPGDRGNAVIAGHLNGKYGAAGIFIDLYKLQKGDKLYVEDNKGISVAFVVYKSRVYDPGYADEVFISSQGAHLNLITCDGVWDEEKNNYSKRLVVFTDIMR